MHHRVKNNLQTVVSLLELQPEATQQDARTAFHDSRNRIYAMSLIHQKLYQTENIASLNMQPYLTELGYYLQDVFNSDKRIIIQVSAAQVDLDVSQAIPVGLIVNEAVTNCFKYAFDHTTEQPKIFVSLEEIDGRLLLVIEDNGRGPAGLSGKQQQEGFGFDLMRGLAEDIEGQFNIESAYGTRISVDFSPNIPLHQLNVV